MIKLTVTNYRRACSLPPITIEKPRRGHIYLEFEEMWTRRAETEKPRLISQKFTGRRFVFLERTVVETGFDEDRLAARDFDHVICDARDFSFLCLRLAKR